MKGNTGIKRIVLAAGYSAQGLRAAFVNEAAFRQELLLAAVLIPLACWLEVATVERILLIASVVLVLIVELLNSAIEAVVDRIGPEKHELSGRAKDIGSAAVLIVGRRRFSWTLIWGNIPVSKEIENDCKEQERNRYRTAGRRAAVECRP